MEELIAHVKQNPDESWAEPHLLEDHLQRTAELSAKFAKVFGSETWGYAAGIGHDAGKGTAKWQQYLGKKSGYGYDETAHLENISGKLDHSAPAAKLAEETFGKGLGRVLSYCMAGHHAGLPNWTGDQASLAFRLQQSSTEAISEELRLLLLNAEPKNLPRRFDIEGMDLSLWIRMLFSCLVDADFLDTENYMDMEKHENRGNYLSIEQLSTRFHTYMQSLTGKAPDTQVNGVRKTVLEDCINAVIQKPGFFSLTVPTGGGKTLSSMAFALKHAEIYKKVRIIYVIPYTSIIEQNSDEFRKAVGTDQVVEHHSNVIADDLTEKSRLASENWDAPLIVTTSVQFFESLFASKSSRARKLHNICNSVIILDEAQVLPVEFLAPILRAMELLTLHYKVSFVLCTATQPALGEQDDVPSFPGIEKGLIREIIQDVPALYKKLKRVEIDIPSDLQTPIPWDDLADELKSYKSALCVVSDRKSCKELFHLMPEDAYHLSALMCAQHRSDIIYRIKKDLNEGKPTKVISTQLVEAGVDLDFPVVYRAMAGLDSIAQAAGRCNREGKLNEQGRLGKVVVFVPPKKPPPGILRKATETAVGMFRKGLRDPVDQSVFPDYFSELYWKANSLDQKGIIRQLIPDSSELSINFRSVSEAFHLIDDSMQRNILIPYGEGAALIKLVKQKGPERWLLRKLQRYVVNVYIDEFEDMRKRGSLEELSPGIFALVCDVEYDQKTGLKTDQELFDPAKYNL